MKSTKRSLFTSAAALVLSVALLVGTTMAWFTDSVTNTGNRIEAGILKIDLLMDKTGAGEYQSIAGSTGDIFSETAGNGSSWEPGKTEIVYLAVQNKGNLALNYNLLFNITDGEPGLVGALEYAVIDGAKAADLADVKTWDELLGIAGVQTGEIVAGKTEAAPNGTLDEIVHSGEEDETDYFALAVHMKEDANNDYKGGSITIDLTLVAKQATGETDGFGNSDYDSETVFPVSDTGELVEAIKNAAPGDNIILSSGSFEIPRDCRIPEGVTITGEGTDKTTIITPAISSGNFTYGLVLDKAGVTISDVTITPHEPWSVEKEYSGIVVVKEGGVVLDNVKMISSNQAAAILVTGSNFGVGDTLTISNSTISGGFKTINIVDGTNGKVIIDNCDVTGVYPFNVNSSSSQNLEIEVRDSALHGWTSYGKIKSAVFTNVEFSQGESDYNFLRPYADTTWTGCTFDESFLIGAGAADLTYTFTNCQYADGSEVTTANVNDLLDSSGGDSNLLQCTVTVNGTRVTVTAD